MALFSAMISENTGEMKFAASYFIGVVQDLPLPLMFFLTSVLHRPQRRSKPRSQDSPVTDQTQAVEALLCVCSLAT